MLQRGFTTITQRAWRMAGRRGSRAAGTAGGPGIAAAALSTRGAPPPVPIVYHPLYSAPQLAPRHQFPMQVGARGAPMRAGGHGAHASLGCTHALLRGQLRGGNAALPRMHKPKGGPGERCLLMSPLASPSHCPPPPGLPTPTEPHTRVQPDAQVFGSIHARLLRTGMIAPTQVHVPPRLPSDKELALVHCPEYLAAFSGCRLDDARVRRWGAAQAGAGGPGCSGWLRPRCPPARLPPPLPLRMAMRR